MGVEHLGCQTVAPRLAFPEARPNQPLPWLGTPLLRPLCCASGSSKCMLFPLTAET